MVNLIWRVRYTDFCYGNAVFSKKAPVLLNPHLKSMDFEMETEFFPWKVRFMDDAKNRIFGELLPERNGIVPQRLYEIGQYRQKLADNYLDGIEPESKITVVVPTLNEEKNIALVIEELNMNGFSKIMLIDGNSMDKTVEIAKNMGAKVLNQNGKGKGNALRQAFSHSDLGEFVVIIDADGSMNPKEILIMLTLLRIGIDVVKGSRFMKYGYTEDMTLLRRIGNSFLLTLVNLIWRGNYTDLCYGYMAFSKKAIDTLYPHLKSVGFEIETELLIKALKLGLKVREVPSIEVSRHFGKSNLKTFYDGFRILKTIISEAIIR